MVLCSQRTYDFINVIWGAKLQNEVDDIYTSTYESGSIFVLFSSHPWIDRIVSENINKHIFVSIWMILILCSLIFYSSRSIKTLAFRSILADSPCSTTKQIEPHSSSTPYNVFPLTPCPLRFLLYPFCADIFRPCDQG